MEVDPIWTRVLDSVIIRRAVTGNANGFHFLQVASPSRGLPQKEWEIADLPSDFIYCDAIRPIDDLVVMARRCPGPSLGRYVPLTRVYGNHLPLRRCELHCLQLSAGRLHPRASHLFPETSGRSQKTQVTKHRLAVLVDYEGLHPELFWRRTLKIWDWETGKLLHVGHFLLISFIALTSNHVIQDETDLFSRDFYFIDDYRLAILRKSGLCPWNGSLAIYDTRGIANTICEVPRLLLRLPDVGSGSRAIGFYGPGEIPNDEHALLLTDQNQALLAVWMKGWDGDMSEPMVFLVITFSDLFALASRSVEIPLEFEEWKHFTLEAEIPLKLQSPRPTV